MRGGQHPMLRGGPARAGGTVDEARIVQMAQELADQLAPGDLDETLRRITMAAVEVLPDVDLASITMKHSDDTLQTYAPTDDLLKGIDQAQYDLREGPCYDS